MLIAWATPSWHQTQLIGLITQIIFVTPNQCLLKPLTHLNVTFLSFWTSHGYIHVMIVVFWSILNICLKGEQFLICLFPPKWIFWNHLKDGPYTFFPAPKILYVLKDFISNTKWWKKGGVTVDYFLLQLVFLNHFSLPFCMEKIGKW